MREKIKSVEQRLKVKVVMGRTAQNMKGKKSQAEND